MPASGGENDAFDNCSPVHVWMDAGDCSSLWHGFIAGHRFADRDDGFHTIDSALKRSPASTTSFSGKHSLKQVKSSVPAPGRRLYDSSNIARRSSKKFYHCFNAAHTGRYGCEAGGTLHPLSPSFGGYL
jgi:hypothetical protein